jgi:hypothetical protein
LAQNCGSGNNKAVARLQLGVLQVGLIVYNDESKSEVREKTFKYYSLLYTLKTRWMKMHPCIQVDEFLEMGNTGEVTVRGK